MKVSFNRGEHNWWFISKNISFVGRFLPWITFKIQDNVQIMIRYSFCLKVRLLKPLCLGNSSLCDMFRCFQCFPPSATVICSLHSSQSVSANLSPLLVACCVWVSGAHYERVMLLLLVGVSVSLFLLAFQTFLCSGGLNEVWGRSSNPFQFHSTLNSTSAVLRWSCSFHAMFVC